MPWGRIDDKHWHHEKVADLDDDLRKGGIALYWLAISWCNDRLTDGRVPTGAVRMLGGDITEADELVRVGLWERDGKGYRIHDFLDFNKSKSQIETERAQRIEAGKAGAAARWNGGSPSTSPDGSPSGSPSEVPDDAASEMHGGDDAPVTRIPSPSSVVPVPDARDEAPETEAIAWLARHKVVLQPHDGYYRHLLMAVERHGSEAVLAVLEELHGAGMPDGDTRGYVFGVRDELDRRKRPNLRAVEKGEDASRRTADWQRRVERTKVRAHDNGYHADERDPGCPRCREVA